MMTTESAGRTITAAMKTVRTSAAVIFGCVSLLFSSPASALNLGDGLVAYFPFNGNAADESGNGHDGTVNGATLTTDRFGNPNQAYRFGEGDTYITAPLASDVFAGDFTASVWFNATDINNGWPSLLAQQNGSFLISIAGELCGCDSPGYLISYSSYAPATFGWGLFRNQPTPIGTYNQVVITKSGTDVAMYLNSSLELQGAVSDPTTVPGGTFWIGRSVTEDVPGGYVFHGVLDDIRIYNRALSDTEVAELYTYESAPSVPDSGSTGLALLGSALLIVLLRSSALRTEPSAR